MSTQPIFYKRVVPLSKEQHGQLYLEPVEGFAFARETNSLFITAVEFPRAAKEYPIVFGSDNSGNVFPVVLLGLKKNQNLYVDKEGQWRAEYIPAYVRRYPFILAQPDSGQDKFAVCIDESYSGFNIAKEGQPVFNAKGAQSPILKQAVEFLKDYQNHVQLTTQFCKTITGLDLLEPMQANVEMKGGSKFALGGFQCVKREKLGMVKPGKLADLVKSGHMELIYAHLFSLNNVSTLLNRLS